MTRNLENTMRVKILDDFVGMFVGGYRVIRHGVIDAIRAVLCVVGFGRCVHDVIVRWDSARRWLGLGKGNHSSRCVWRTSAP
jgi:hypothetical protein